MAKPCAAFLLVFLCLSMLILSTPEVDAKLCMSIKTLTNISCEMDDCDCDYDHKCGEWDDESYGNCKQHHIRTVCKCTLNCPETSSTSNA